MTINQNTKFNIGDIVYMRYLNHKEQYVKAGPIKIKGIELRIDSKGNMSIWYNCESANFYKFAFFAKGSKHYVKESDLYTEKEINDLGYDVESKGYVEFYRPDGTPKSEDELMQERIAYWKSQGKKVIIRPDGTGWYVE